LIHIPIESTRGDQIGPDRILRRGSRESLGPFVTRNAQQIHEGVGMVKESRTQGPLLGMKLIPQGRGEALCFVCTLDKPFLLSKVAGNFTIHDCDILEAEIHVRDGIVTDLYRIRVPEKYESAFLEDMLFESLQKVLEGHANIEREIFQWEKEHRVTREQIVPKFESIRDDRAILTVEASNAKGLLHKISWALSLAGMSIEKAIISTTEEEKAEDVFWIKQRYGEKIGQDYQHKVLELLKISVDEGRDPIEQAFRKEINMIYRQQLRRRGSGYRTAKLYADVHLRLLGELFNRIKGEMEIDDHPLVIGVYGGIGSGAIGFTSDVDCIFLYDGKWSEEYEKLKRIFISEFKRISDLEIDASFLPYHINYFFVGHYDGEGWISFRDFFEYIAYVEDLRRQTDNRLFEPQFFHFPWAFSIRFVGSPAALDQLKREMRKRLRRGKNQGYQSIKTYLLRERKDEIKNNYVAYLKGNYFPKEIEFLDATKLRRLYQQRSFEAFFESIQPYEAIKYVFRRGVLPLLHIIHHDQLRTDMGLLSTNYRHILPAVNFMLKAFNVRKTLFIMGKWDLDYFLYIMECESERTFCERYLKYQKEILGFVKRLTRDHDHP
jgi:hypothetical protein